MKICSVHKLPIEHKTGVSKTTNKPYSFDACPTPAVNGVYCKADIIEVPDEVVPEIREPLEEPKPTDWDAVARGNIALDAWRIATNFYVKKDIDDEDKLETLAERVYTYAWNKRQAK